MKYKPVDVPKFAHALFGTIACDAGSIATTICAVNYDEGPPLTILDWSIDELSPNVLRRIVPKTEDAMTSLYADIKVLYRPGLIRVDPVGAGRPLFEQAEAAGCNVELITADGAARYDKPADRVLAASYYLTCGAVSLARSAFDYSIPYRGVTANHLVSALQAFGTSESNNEPTVLLVAAVNAVLEAFADYRLKPRASLEIER